MTLTASPQAASVRVLRRVSPPLMVVLVSFIAAALFLVAAGYPWVGVAVFAPVFIAMTFARPDYALFVIFGLTLFPFDVTLGLPVKTALGDLSLLAAIPAILARSPRLRLPTVLVPIGIYFASCFASSALNGVSFEGLICVVQMALYLVVGLTLLMNYSNDPTIMRRAIDGLIVFGAIMAVASIAQPGGYVLGIHKNAVGASLAFSVLATTGFFLVETDRKAKRWLGVALVLTILGLICTLSRGAWAGTFVGICFILAFSRRPDMIRNIAIIIVPLIAIGWFILPQEAKSYASDVGLSSNNAQARLVSIDYAWQFFQANPLIGSGVGLRKMYDATNIVVLTLAETGVVGLFAFGLIHVVLIRQLWRGHRVYPSRDHRSALIAIAGAFIIAKLVHGVVDHYWSRNLLIPWGAAGAALLMIEAGRRARSQAWRAASLAGNASSLTSR